MKVSIPLSTALILSRLYFIFSQNSGYFYDGYRDHLFFPFDRGEKSFANFTASFWFRFERKEKFGNLEQCILSHGSWEGR